MYESFSYPAPHPDAIQQVRSSINALPAKAAYWKLPLHSLVWSDGPEFYHTNGLRRVAVARIPITRVPILGDRFNTQFEKELYDTFGPINRTLEDIGSPFRLSVLGPCTKPYSCEAGRPTRPLDPMPYIGVGFTFPYPLFTTYDSKKGIHIATTFLSINHPLLIDFPKAADEARRHVA